MCLSFQAVICCFSGASATTTGSNAFLSDIHHGGDLPLGLWWLPHVAGVGVEPTYQAYETRENPLLDPAIVITS